MSTRLQIAISCAVWAFLTSASSLAHDESEATWTVLQNAFCCTDETPFVEHRESQHRRPPGSEPHRSGALMIALPETSAGIAEEVLFRSGTDLKDGSAPVFARDTRDTLLSSQSLLPVTQQVETYQPLQSFPDQQRPVDVQYSQLSRPTDSSSEWFLQMLPDGIIYRSYWAGLHEPRLGVQLTTESSGQSFWDPTLDARIGLVRYGNDDSLHPQGWQIDLEGAAMARLTLDYWRDLDTVDFRGGIPLTYGIDNWQFKLGYYHLSSHLGDEFAINNPGSLGNRINYVRDAIVLGVSWYPIDIMRLYAEGAYAFVSTGGAEPLEFQIGSELSRPGVTDVAGTPFAAVNVHLREEHNFGGDLTIQSGWLWRNKTGRVFRIGAMYFNGKSSQYQFYDDWQEHIGVGMWYDF